MTDMITTWVHEAYWRDDVNCATAMLSVLGRVHDVAIASQVMAAATGMHGAGGSGAQCGLVEGGLMFIGLWGRERGRPDAWTVEACRGYAVAFTDSFGSLDCRVLRPQGFAPEQPPHLCEGLSVAAVRWAVDWTRDYFSAARI